jgi:hypothetical protein
MSGWILAVAVAVIGLVTTFLWFGVSRRREAEVEIGIQALAAMKWRDSIDVLLEALQREGHSRTHDPASASGATDLLLDHGNEKVLLAYKPGTAYRLIEANIREFANTVQQRGAQRGLLLTLGTADTAADAIAESAGVQVLDGRSLWTMVRPFMPPATLGLVRNQAAARTRKGLWTGVAGSLLAGAAVQVLGGLLPASVGETTSPGLAQAVQVAPRPADAVQTPGTDEAMLRQLNATAREMAEIAKLPSAELARRRASAAKEIALIPQVNTAAWSAQSRLLVTLNRSDGKDKVLIDEMCRLITQYEELRYTRIQMEPPTGSTLPVRWRLCD